jgi:hypothetical protein
MADNTDPAPVKATPPRKTMAPAGRDPRGADFTRAVEGMSDTDLDNMEQALRAERRRRQTTPREPSFGISEGERSELEARGKTTSPFTGEVREGDGAPREK